MATTGKLIRNKDGKVVSNVTTSNDRAISRGKGQSSSKKPSIRQKAISKTTDAMESVSRQIPGTAPNRLKKAQNPKQSILQAAEKRRREKGDKVSR